MKIYISIRTKIIILLLCALGTSLWAYISIGTSLVVNDKISYIYDYSLGQVSNVSALVEGQINNAARIGKILCQLSDNEAAEDAVADSYLREKNLESIFLYTIKDGNLFYFRTAGLPNDRGLTLPFEMGWKIADFHEDTPVIGVVKSGAIPVGGIAKSKAGNTLAFIALVKIDPQTLTGQSNDFQNFIFNANGKTLLPHADNELTTNWDSAIKELNSGKFVSGVQEMEINHKNYIIGYRHLYQNNLLVSSFVLKDLAFTAIKTLTIRSLALGLSILLLAAGLSILMAKGLTIRLSQLYKASNRIAEGDYTNRVSIKSFIGDEVVALADSFNVMSEKIIKAMAALEDYAKNLEKKVDIRTAELKAANHLLEAILNSLGQGFLIFDEEGNCLPIYSKICEKILETVPTKNKIWKVLKLTEQQTDEFKKWSKLIFEETLPFEDLVSLGPSLFTHSQNKRIELEYFLMRDDQTNKIQGIVLVATDHTVEFEAKLNAVKEHDHALMIVRLVKHKEQFMSLIRESHEFLAQIRKIINGEQLSASEFESVLRWLHTMKGGSSAFLMTDLAQLIHHYESKLVALKDQPLNEIQKSMKSSESEVDHIEAEFRNFFVKNQDVVGRSIEDIEKRLEIKISEFVQLCDEISKLPGGGELKKKYMAQFFMEPISQSLLHYDDVIQRIATDLGKSVKPLQIQGGDTRILLGKHSELLSTFIHAFRNAVDHGIEPSEEREMVGKDPAGKIEILISKTEKNGLPWIRIEEKDDGKGIDPNIIRKKMVEKGLLSAQTESDQEVIQHVFDSGFSTRSDVTSLSGRGVGMDAIRDAARQSGGDATIFSEVGKGTSLIVEFPDPLDS